VRETSSVLVAYLLFGERTPFLPHKLTLALKAPTTRAPVNANAAVTGGKSVRKLISTILGVFAMLGVATWL
jgi:hypothetical protein